MSNKKTMPKPMRIISLVLCVMLSLVLAVNITIIIKGTLNPDRPPSVLGVTSMMVLSGSMSGDAPDHIEVGDLIFAKNTDPDKLKVGDIITFMQNGTTTVTHRIIDINDDGTFKTKGDANNTEDSELVSKEDVIGKFWFRIPKLGDLALFAQTPVGMIVFIGIPLGFYIAIDTILRARQNKKDKQKADAEKASKEDLEKELAELKAKMALKEKGE